MSAAAAPLCMMPHPLLPPGVPDCGWGAARCSGRPAWFWGEGWAPSGLLHPSAALSGEQIIERGLSGALGGNLVHFGADGKSALFGHLRKLSLFN